MRFLFIVTCVYSITLLYSCNENKAGEKGKIISAEKMQAVMWDVLQADAFTQNFIKKDSSKKDSIENAALQKKIFELHKISREDYYASYQFYAAKPGEMKKMMDSITVKAERDRNKVMEEKYAKPAKIVN